MRPAPNPIKGLTATMTSVSFQPLTKPTQKPHTKVVKRCRKMATWSAMASLILLMSLWTHRRGVRTLNRSVSTEVGGHSYSDMRVLSSPTEVQSNQPISILITLLKYIFLMSWICLAAAVTHMEICQFGQRHCQGVWHLSVQLRHGESLDFDLRCRWKAFLHYILLKHLP